MTGWDIALLAISGYVAVVSLARLMIARRDALWNELQAEALEQQRQQKEQQRREQAAKKAAEQAEAIRPARQRS